VILEHFMRSMLRSHLLFCTLSVGDVFALIPRSPTDLGSRRSAHSGRHPDASEASVRGRN
jgi:hypothetical protein